MTPDRTAAGSRPKARGKASRKKSAKAKKKVAPVPGVPAALQRFAKFAGAFYVSLAALMAALPFLVQIEDVLPYRPEHFKFVRFLASVGSLAFAGAYYLRIVSTRQRMRPIGLFNISVAIALGTLYYLAAALQPEPRALEDVGFAALYVVILITLALGLTQMACFAFGLPDRDPEPAVPIPGLLERLRSARATGKERQKLAKKLKAAQSKLTRYQVQLDSAASANEELQAKVVELESGVTKLEVELANSTIESAASYEATIAGLSVSVQRTRLAAVILLSCALFFGWMWLTTL